MSVANAPTKTSLDDERRAHEPSMEEILASIRRIIADDDTLPTARRETRRQDASVEAPLRRSAVEDRYPGEQLESMDLKLRESDDRTVDAQDRFRQRPATERSLYPAGAELAIFPTRTESVSAPPANPGREEAETGVGEYRAEDLSGSAGGEEDESVSAYEAEEDTDGFYAEAGSESACVAEVPVYGVEDASAAAPLVSPDAAASIASHFEALAASMFIKDSGLLQDYAKEMLRPMLKQWLDDNLPVMVERLVRAEIERVARGRR